MATMPFRKLKYKRVLDSRATHTGKAGEVFIDESTNVLYVGDGTTVGGNAVGTVNSFVVDANGGAIDFSKDVVFVTAGQNYTLADGNTIGHVLNIVVNGGTSGGIQITVANASYITGGNITTATNFNWSMNSGSGLENTMATRRCIWDGTNWVLDHAV